MCFTACLRFKIKLQNSIRKYANLLHNQTYLKIRIPALSIYFVILKNHFQGVA